MGMRIGYARVSSSGQRLDVQMDRLADCDRIFSEKAFAASAKGRPELQKALDYVRDEMSSWSRNSTGWLALS